MRLLPATRSLCGLLVCAGLGWAVTPWTLPHYASPTDTPYSVRVDSPLVYGLGKITKNGIARDKPLLMDAYLPVDQGKLVSAKAAIIFMHPGSFLKGSRRIMAEQCTHLARLGVVAFTIDYRMQLDSPLVEVPAWQLEIPDSLLPPSRGDSGLFLRAVNAAYIDTKAALRYVHAHANSLGVDTANIFLGGGSAGAVTALAAGVTPPDVYVSDSIGKPIRPENHPEASMSVRGIVNWSGGLYADLSFLDSQDPPIMNYHGSLDDIVDVEEAIRIDRRCGKVGLDCELHIVPGGPHLPKDGASDGDFLSVMTSFVMRAIVPRSASTASNQPSLDHPRWIQASSGSLALTGLPESVAKLDFVGLDGRVFAAKVLGHNGVWTIRPQVRFSQGVVVRARLENGETRSWLVPMIR